MICFFFVQSVLLLDDVADQIMSSPLTSNLRYKDPRKKSEEEALNTFQMLTSGKARPFRPEVLDYIGDMYADKAFRPTRHLHGPFYGLHEVSRKLLESTFFEIGNFRRKGTLHRLWSKWQHEAASKDPGAADVEGISGINVAMPIITFSSDVPPKQSEMVIVNNSDDARRIARQHVRKQPNFTPFFFQSLIATTDNEHWRRQRNHLNEVFLPNLSLEKIFKVSLKRARKCADIMDRLRAECGANGVQVHEFFLNEAQAQLQLALFGMDTEFMNRTNKPIRDAFAGINPDLNFAKDMCLDMMSKVGENPNFGTPSDPDVASGRKDVFGPLSKSVMRAGSELNLNLKDQFGNMMLILFAGHDTTGHTMTWLTFELARRPKFQAMLHDEVDAFFSHLGDREMTYADCKKLPFLTRCVMETLRLWPAVANGTFRQLQFDETVRGPAGHDVTLPKGTYVQIPHMLRHRNERLWGVDANEFNPMRDFREEELWGAEGKVDYKGYNPASARFSPFTFTPRDCLGKNFAQMEMRAILAHLFHRFKFELTPAYEAFRRGEGSGDFSADGHIEVNAGTMGPRDLTPDGEATSAKRFANNQPPKLGMWLRVVRRRMRRGLPARAML